MPRPTREVRLVRRPVGLPDPSDFELVDVTLPDPEDGQILVQNTHLSVDPYMRPRMDGVRTYIDPYELGQPMDGGAVGRVLVSRSDRVPEGAWVAHQAGWREHALVRDRAATLIDVDGVKPSVHLGLAGMPGFTAWTALASVGALQPGETVFVSACAGAVGSAAGQLARTLGADRVIGSTRSTEKAARAVREFGYDAVVVPGDVPLEEQLRRAAPQGVDVVVENVGGEVLAAALDVMNDFGRMALCGAVSGYNESPRATGNLFQAVQKRLLLRGFIVTDHWAQFREYRTLALEGLRAGTLVAVDTETCGLESAPEAFRALFSGMHVGKMIVALQ
jgi:NADPH-dependent curcumin reductase CurA